MGVEFYLLRPRDKRCMYLGKGTWGNLEGVNQVRPADVTWECYKDVLLDIIDADCWCADDNMEFLSTLAGAIWEFVEGEDVRLINDCELNFSEIMKEYNEDEEFDICNIARSIYGG